MSSARESQVVYLVTGCAGFIASFVVDALVARGDTVVGLDSMEYCSSGRNLNDGLHHFEHANICDAVRVSEVLSRFRITHILHFAAESHVDRSFGNSFKFTTTNVLGTHTLLECCRRYVEDGGEIHQFLHVSTDEVYGGNPSDERFTTESVLRPTSPYAASKVGAEALVMSYRMSFQMNCLISRCNNVFGPRQFPEKLIPKLFLRASRGLPFQVHGSGQQLRSYLYVTDVARAFLLLSDRGKVGEIYNIGAEKERSVLDVMREVNKLVDCAANIEHVEDRKFNDQRYHVEDSKLRRLGWEPEVSFTDGLARTKQWYETHPGWWPQTLDDALSAHGKAEVPYATHCSAD